MVGLLLATQGALLFYSSLRHSPTHLEPAFLASGISHWQRGRFELYRVDPPLVRLVAAVPVLLVGCRTDWGPARLDPGSRSEFAVGSAFVEANREDLIDLIRLARWACIPFSLCGAYFAYRWARELYGGAAGVVTLVLYVFEPNLLAHGELITTDAACTSLGIVAGYTYWRWLKKPGWGRAAIAGVALGLVELSKLSWILLFAIWPLLYLVWVALSIIGSRPRAASACRASAVRQDTLPVNCDTFNDQGDSSRPTRHAWRAAGQLVTVLLVALYVINLGYAFDGFGTRLRDFQFVSTCLTGLERPGAIGNRFRYRTLVALRLPVPKQYVLGLDCQTKDLESFPERSYLRGKWTTGGWWYYYMYAILVKMPCGTWGLLCVVLLARLSARRTWYCWRDEVVVILPALLLCVCVSSQTAFNIHGRYVLPAMGLLLIFVGQAGVLCSSRLKPLGAVVTALITYSVSSALFAYPHELAYFNEMVGGPRNGYRHLLGSNLDWGQDLLLLRDWMKVQKDPVFVYCAGGMVRPLPIVSYTLLPARRQESDAIKGRAPSRKLVVVSVGFMAVPPGPETIVASDVGYQPLSTRMLTLLADLPLVDRIGYTFYVVALDQQ